MELRQLRHFLALAEEQNFTRAAEREHIVQSGLSNSIHSLERELETPLYVRGTRPIRLTAAGFALEGPARRTISSAGYAHQAVRDTREAITGTLRVGAMQLAEHVVPLTEYVARFARDYPGITVEIHQLAALDMLAMVEAGELDCAIVPAPPSAGHRLRLVKLGREPMKLAVNPAHPLAGEKTVRLSQLEHERFVEVPLTWTSRLLNDAAFAGRGLGRSIVCEANSWDLILQLVGAGVGVGIVPGGLSHPTIADPTPSVLLKPLADVQLERHLHLAFPSVGELAPAVTRFIDEISHIRNDKPPRPATDSISNSDEDD
ncbi:MAG: transcriptional regulator, LysR family [Microbacteriaceae bacterium]|nr:transcriptional regulator, LysR family [Microbacteriaceae bacterium]